MSSSQPSLLSQLGPYAIVYLITHGWNDASRTKWFRLSAHALAHTCRHTQHAHSFEVYVFLLFYHLFQTVSTLWPTMPSQNPSVLLSLFICAGCHVWDTVRYSLQCVEMASVFVRNDLWWYKRTSDSTFRNTEKGKKARWGGRREIKGLKGRAEVTY